MCIIRFKYEILYRRIGDELTIHTVEVVARDSIAAEAEFNNCILYRNCEILDTNMIGACSICG